MADNQQGPDFKRLARQLYVVALRVFAEYGLGGRDATIPGTGLSPEDFVWGVISEFAEGRHKHHASKGQLVTYLGTALRRDVIDALRKASHKHEDSRDFVSSGTEDGGAGKSDGLDQIQDHKAALNLEGVLAELDDERYIARVRALVADEPELREVCEAIFDLEVYTPWEIADALNIEVAEYHNRKRKLRRRLLEHQLVRLRQ